MCEWYVGILRLYQITTRLLKYFHLILFNWLFWNTFLQITFGAMPLLPKNNRYIFFRTTHFYLVKWCDIKCKDNSPITKGMEADWFNRIFFECLKPSDLSCSTQSPCDSSNTAQKGTEAKPSPIPPAAHASPHSGKHEEQLTEFSRASSTVKPTKYKRWFIP